MGYGVPAAVGAKAARPDATVDLHRRRRLLPDDLPGARDRGARAAADRRRDRQQRLARDGAPVAGALLRRALRRDAPDQAGARLRAARRGARRAPASWSTTRTSSTSTLAGRARLRPHRRRRRPRRPGREVLPDGARRAPPRSTSSSCPTRLEDREDRRDEPAHGLRRAREQAGRARARLADVRAARLQHPEPRRRPDRAARHLAAHAPRRLLASTRSSRSRSRCTSSSTCCGSSSSGPASRSSASSR